MTELAPDNSRRHPLRRRRGLALVVTVSLLALMLILVVALLETTQDGYKAAVLVSAKDEARLHGQDAVHVALAQLRSATEETFANGLPKPWTSQPGAVRVHRMDGALEKVYKLYTAAAMQAERPEDLEKDVPDDWAEREADFVDLNAPVRTREGELRFPVVDPRAWTTDPLTAVEGFEYAEVKGAVGASAETADEKRLPMPVRWLYKLQDGTLGTLTAEGKFQGSDGEEASALNPVVSRFAFWVDDETGKVNVNTAAEGSYWDTPRADTDQERALAKTVPSRLEYMRQAGHPAGVSLSSVLLPGRRFYPMGFPRDSLGRMQAMQHEDVRDLWRLGRLTVAERHEGTALGGTMEAEWTMLWHHAQRESVRHGRYADVDDLLFDPADTSRFPNLWGEGQAGEGKRRRSAFFTKHPEAVERLKQSRFFLTAQSAAPETTLFGTPRVAMWPLAKDTILNGGGLGNPDISRDTVYSHKVAMAAVVKGRPYFVQRSDPGDGIRDFRVISGNRVLFEYLQRLTNQPFPGFDSMAEGGSTFAAKYGDDRDGILVGMMDYLRAANCADQQLPNKMQYSVLCPGAEHHGFGQISPLQLSTTLTPKADSNHIQGLGRVMTISEVALIITCRAEVDEEGKVRGTPSAAGREILEDPQNPPRPGDRELEVGFLVETFLPQHGWTDYRPFVNLALAGGPADGPLEVANHLKAPLPEMTLNGEPLVPATKQTTASSSELPPLLWNGAGGSLGVRALAEGVLQFKPVIIRAQDNGTLPRLDLRTAAGDPNQLKVALYDAPKSLASQDLLQVVPLVLPDIPMQRGMPLPELDEELEVHDLQGRLLQAAEQGTRFLAETDVVQSLAPAHGDYRVTAGQRWAESRDGANRTPLFLPHPRWGMQLQAHTLRDPSLPVETGNWRGYIPDLAYAAAFRPDLPETMTGGGGVRTVTIWQQDKWMHYTVADALDSLRLDSGKRGAATPEVTGDFDNGIGNGPDGPYGNRPDDGHWGAAQQGKLPYFDNVSHVGHEVPPVTLAGFSPQRLMPSPVMFGSLPTGVRAQVPWQTLLFRPQPQHYGAQVVPDHLLLDLFWMPVLEPEPISTHLETQGKINMNHEILPFAHITRATALHAALKAEALIAIPDTAAETYKNGMRPGDRFRRHLDVKKTLALWKQQVFDVGNVFLTPGQMCEQYLVPEGMTGAGAEVTPAEMEAFWAQHRVTGDNSKERPYAHLYSRLTTRSNTYRVHFIAQSLQKVRSSPKDGFDPKRDQVKATYSGQAILSRRLDLDHPDLPDYQVDVQARPLDHFYRWSIDSVKSQ